MEETRSNHNTRSIFATFHASSTMKIESRGSAAANSTRIVPPTSFKSSRATHKPNPTPLWCRPVAFTTAPCSYFSKIFSVSFGLMGSPKVLTFSACRSVERIIFCGENNAFDQSFVALLGMSDPPSRSAPGGRPRYQYANAPDNSPRKSILFPRTELIVHARCRTVTHVSGRHHRRSRDGG
jgi:hypothetical protein